MKRKVHGPHVIAMGLYHQAPRCHPVPYTIPAGCVCVELVTGGRGWVRCGDEWKEVTAGTIVWNRPGEDTIGRSDFEDPYRCLGARITGWKDCRLPVPRLSRWDDRHEMQRFIEQILRLHAAGNFDQQVLVGHFLGRVRFEIELSRRHATEDALPAGVQRVLQLIEREHARPLTLRQMAAAAGWSVAHLHDRFRAATGISPHQALLRRRIEAARGLLAGSDLPAKQVAAACGFGGPAAFCALFRRACGMTPREYRRRQWRPAA